MPEVAQAQAGIRRFTVVLVVLAIGFTAVTYAAIYLRTRALLYASLREQAENHFDLVVTVRAWNADQNGVWVQMRPGIEPNPYLEDLRVDATTETTDGVALTLRNPAVMASEISQLLEAKSGVMYHLVALDPLNPENRPDEWERESLETFTRNREPRWVIQETDRGEMFRYMRPLNVEAACIECHQEQDYRIGQVAGATTVEIPMDTLEERLRANAITLALLGVASAGAAGSSIWLMTNRLGARVRGANEGLAKAARTDDLTGLCNRRGTFVRLEQEIDRAHRNQTPLSVLMLDVDHFKRINDQHGHCAGDEALRHFSHLVDDESRSYDVVGRVGGEEFLLVAPETEAEDAAALAERIRARVSGEPVRIADELVALTVSIGVVALRPAEMTDSLLMRADAAMYAAKDAGRDRVFVEE